jgi:membrane protease YdiL (CAAX protease family)
MTEVFPLASPDKGPSQVPTVILNLRLMLAVAFGYSWTVWIGLLALERSGIISALAPGEYYGWGGLGPSLGAIAVVLSRGGFRQGVAFVKSALDVRADGRWYLAATVTVALAALGGILLYVASGGTWIAPAGLWRIPVLVVVGLIVATMEEFGWRAFALPNLLSRVSPVRGALLLGAIWASWHFAAVRDSWPRIRILGTSSGVSIGASPILCIDDGAFDADDLDLCRLKAKGIRGGVLVPRRRGCIGRYSHYSLC